MDPVTETVAPAQPTEPAAPPPAAPAAEDSRSPLERLSREEYGTWMKTGDLPEAITGKPTPPAEPAAKSEGDDAPALDARGQQIRGADGKFVSKSQHRINERIREAVERGTATERQAREAAERKAADLEARLSGHPPAVNAVEPAKPAEPPKPKFEDFETLVGSTYPTYGAAVTAFQDARDTWKDEKAARDTQARQADDAKTAAQRATETLVSAHEERERALAATTPDYEAKTRDIRAALADTPLTRALLKSPVSAHLLLHCAEYPEDMQRIGALGLSDEAAAIYELGKLAAKYETPAPPAAPSLPLKKTVSAAPEPATVLGTRSAEPADAKAAALARKDVSAYLREADREDLARVGRR